MLRHIVLESTDSASDGQSNESSCSLQAEPTASAKDSSDISTEFSSELELASSPETRPHPWSFRTYFSSSGNSPYLTHKNRVSLEPFVVGNDTDESVLSTNGSDCDTDDDIQILKFPRCIMCSAANENYFFQFCHSCYKIRKDFFPQKPKPKVRKRTHLENPLLSSSDYHPCELSRGVSKNTTPLHQLQEYFESETIDKTQKSTENTLNGQVLNEWTASPNCTQDSGIGTNNTPNEPFTDVGMDDKCLACSVNDTNALFLHGKTGHRCCCYQCAKRIWLETSRCPICRSKVNNIIKILNS